MNTANTGKVVNGSLLPPNVLLAKRLAELFVRAAKLVQKRYEERKSHGHADGG